LALENEAQIPKLKCQMMPRRQMNSVPARREQSVQIWI
jgi:hypothetical protein